VASGFLNIYPARPGENFDILTSSKTFLEPLQLARNVEENARLPFRCSSLEVKADLAGNGTRRYVVRAAKRREKVVQRIFISEVDDRQTSAPLMTIAVEQIIVTNGDVEHMPRGDTRRIVVIILSSWRRYLYEGRSVT